MTLNQVYRLLALCLHRMPASHPKPRLIVHESAEAMVEYLGEPRHEFQLHRGYPSSMVVGMADAEGNAIHMPVGAFATSDAEDVLDTLLHEIGHLHAAARHGLQSRQHQSEALANRFARDWLRRLRNRPRRKR